MKRFTVKKHVIPALLIAAIAATALFLAFSQESKRHISFLGDSITTYEGYSDSADYNSTLADNLTYYRAGSLDLDDTWWYQVVKGLRGKLCVNNSCSASRVTDTKPGLRSGVEGASQLHNKNEQKPDIIIIYMGTNDIANGVPLEDFADAYKDMLDVIEGEYPKAEVYCCTLLPESRTAGKDDVLAGYNEIIRTQTTEHNYGIIDFYSELTEWNYMTHTNEDGALRVHPTAEGMEMLSRIALSSIEK
ncbi:MAG: SGNH/GDSL hydrolase family protein [Clostridia bacterium]|nr:SGNH/GDSL hydrolase family protein [Clostridia bacterium]